MMSEALLQAEYVINGMSSTKRGERREGEEPARRPRVVIVGGGFGGISAAKALGNSEADVLVLSRTNYHGFWMMLYQVAGAQIEPEAIATPVRKMLRRYRNVRFQIADVQGVDIERKLVQTEAEAIPYDYLILAAGSATNYFGNDDFGAHTLSIHDVSEAERLRDQVLQAFERAAREPAPAHRAALMTIVLIGGGPTGVELAGAFAELMRGALRKDYPTLDMIDMSAARVVLVEGSKTVLGTFPVGLQRSAQRKLERLGVELRLGSTVAAVGDEIVTLADGSVLNAHTIVWAAGVRAVPLADALGVALGRAARVKVEPTLNLPGHPEVFAIGDMAYLEGYHGGAYPMVAQVALQMGKQAGHNILASLRGRPTGEFRYFDIGQLAIVGRGAAVLDTFGIRFSGLIGWLVWLFIHLVNLPGIRNQLAVLMNWLYTIVTGEAGVRATTDGEPHGATQAAPARPIAPRTPVLRPVLGRTPRHARAGERKRAA
jgi:NADH:ubiquinone reductase (H+-translocating)